jgi:ppGpp synthetase/RelA/SpoT-type nucleotidyltranferase
MTEDEFLQRWKKEQPIYEAWGRLVAFALTSALSPLIAPVSADVFIRIPIKPRLKGDGSLLTKAFYRSKPYSNPYDDITDKVGVRIVLLIASQMRVLQKVIEGCPAWSVSKDKDFEDEREREPLKFSYQSDHYIVRSRAEATFEGITIPDGTPCEVQVRTLLQHAQSELTHDTIYKPSVESTAEMLRATAKSMALIEATNDYFEQVMEAVTRATGESRKFAEALCGVYRDFTGVAPDPTRADGLLMEAYAPQPSAAIADRLKRFLNDKAFVADRLRERGRRKILFRQPSILLAYLAVSSTPKQALDLWPLTRSEIEPIYSDLGESLPA